FFMATSEDSETLIWCISKASACAVRHTAQRVGWVERSETHRDLAKDDGFRYALPILRATSCATQVMGDDAGAPTLAISGVHFTEMQPPRLSQTWSAVVAVDASHCAAKAT